MRRPKRGTMNEGSFGKPRAEVRMAGNGERHYAKPAFHGIL